MFSKLSIAFALLAASAQIVSAAPPACLLAAVNTQPDPSDMAAICGAGASKVQSQIKSLCGGNANAAMSAYTDACKSAGHAVSIATSTTPSSTPLATPYGAGSGSGTSMPSFKSTASTGRPTGTGVTAVAPLGTGSPYVGRNSTVVIISTPTAPPATLTGARSSAAPTSSSKPLTGGAGQTELSMFALVIAGLVAMA